MFRISVVAVLLAGPALAQTCYRLPFSNPTLSDGWGSTCCGRTNPHRGVDFPRAAGTAIPAVADGVVRLKTTSGCLGNVVIVQHADGMFSGYSHMLGGSPLAVGAAVSIGQTVGQVGNTGTCSLGAHLHLTMSATLGGYASGVTVDPYAFIVARTSCNRAPVGALDAASCSGISGWAQDPNVATSAIPAHVYIGGPAGSPAARGYNLQANLHRSDLCTAIGSCAHGFSMPAPLSYFDGVDHPVFAYGIDSAGGPNTLLGQKTLRCVQATLPTFEPGSVRRRLPSIEVLTAWKRGVDDIAPIPDAALDAIPNGPDLSAAPELVKADDSVDIYVREHRVLRHVGSPAVIQAWKLPTFKTVPAAELAGAMKGAPWPSSPFLAKGSSTKVYLIDAPPPLWAELISDDLPSTLAAGAVADVTFKLRNRGSLKWDAAVQLAPVPRDEPSALCDPTTWALCTRVASMGEVLPGQEGLVTVKVRAPAKVGELTACFGLVSGTHAFSDPGQGGPADDAVCRTLRIVAAGTPTVPSGGKTSTGERDPDVRGGCAQAGGSAAALLAALFVLTLSPNRRRWPLA